MLTVFIKSIGLSLFSPSLDATREGGGEERIPPPMLLLLKEICLGVFLCFLSNCCMIQDYWQLV